MEKEKILVHKDGMKFVKLSTNHFNLSFQIKNNNIRLPEVIHFDLIKLIYDLNPDIYEKSVVDKKTENEAVITLLMRHFFEDLGLPQKYTHINMKREVFYDEVSGNCTQIVFTTSSVATYERPTIIPPDAELVLMDTMQITVNCLSNHLCEFNCLVVLNNQFKMLPFMEKMIGTIVNKVFNRGKEFIEHIR